MPVHPTACSDGVNMVSYHTGLHTLAEVYGFGKSEKYLGEFQKDTNTSVKIATKFGPLPWRFTSDAPVKALKVNPEGCATLFPFPLLSSPSALSIR